MLWSCDEVLNVEVLIIVLCPSSLAHWLVGFWSGDSHCFFLFSFCLFFVSGFLACFFFLFFLFIFCFLSFVLSSVIA